MSFVSNLGIRPTTGEHQFQDINTRAIDIDSNNSTR